MGMIYRAGKGETMTISSRRGFLKQAGAGALSGLGSWEALLPQSLDHGGDGPVHPDRARFGAELEPLVQLIETTERDKCLEAVFERLVSGVSYRQFLGALFLAGVREVNPRPCGFKLHCVFVIHAVHLMSLDAPVGEHLLPLFYALDYLKQCQADDAIRGDYVMRPLTGRLPDGAVAHMEFAAAMEAWDLDRAERAVVALARQRGAPAVFEELWPYAARDWRGIGHKAIYTVNAWRTLQTIGWEYAEPVLRSLVQSLLDKGKAKEVDGYTFDNQCYLPNVARIKAAGPIPAGWRSPRGEASVTRNLLAAVRTGTTAESCGEALRYLVQERGAAGAIWDAVHLAAVELSYRGQGPGVGVHPVTSANALHQAFLHSQNPNTQLLLLLQAVGWMGQFNKVENADGTGLRKRFVTDLAPADLAAKTETALPEALADVSTRRDLAASKVFRLGQDAVTAQAFMAAVRRLTFAKADEPHFYKYPAALFEDHRLVSPAWQPHLLAATVYYLKGPDAADSPVMRRTREAVRSLRAH
jgi:hypothetical protein